jgi:hypothetical protein
VADAPVHIRGADARIHEYECLAAQILRSRAQHRQQFPERHPAGVVRHLPSTRKS